MIRLAFQDRIFHQKTWPPKRGQTVKAQKFQTVKKNCHTVRKTVLKTVASRRWRKVQTQAAIKTETIFAGRSLAKVVG
jgi:hypothetical protein